MSTKIIVSCSTGISSEIIAKRIREAAEIAEKKMVIEDIANLDEALNALSDGDVLLLSPQLGHMQKELQAKKANAKVIVISTAAYSTMDGEKILADLEKDITINDVVTDKPVKNIVMVCTEGLSSAGIANAMQTAVEALDPTTEYQVVSKSASIITAQKLADVDLVLLAPGVEYMREKIEAAIPAGTPMDTVDGKHYGTADGKAIMEKALTLLK